AAVPPTFAVLPPLLGKEGTQISFTVSAGDLDGATLAYSQSGTLPNGAKFDPTTQQFTWTPAFGQAGVYDFKFVATDSLTNTSATQDVSVTILPTDQPPTLPALGGHVVLIGHQLTLPITGSSPEVNAVLTYTATGLPTGANLNSGTGVLSWTPTGIQVGMYQILVTVSDGTLSASQGLILVASTMPVPP